MSENQVITPEQLEEYMQGLYAKSKVAQKKFEREFTTNRRVDEVLRAIGMKTCEYAEELCTDALNETKMGNVNDKMSKLKGIVFGQWAICKGQNTVDYEDSPLEPGIKILYKPMGVIGCVMPSTNPVATIIGNAMMALKGRNSVIIAPHPMSVRLSVKMVKLLREALESVGAPADLIQCISEEYASREATNLMMSTCDACISTGGAGRVKAAYSSGKPAFGVGQGNVQEIVDLGISDAELERQATLCVAHRAKDNGVPCAGAQTVHIHAQQLEQWKGYMQEHGAFLIDKDEDIAALRALVFPDGGTKLNRAVVGKFPYQVGEMCGLNIPETAKIMLVKNQAWGEAEVLCREILFPIVRYTVYEKFEDAVDRAVANLEVEGAGHTSTLWTTNDDHVEYAAKRIPVGRFHINQPTMGGRIPIITSITIGCGTWGGNSVSENLTFRHLLNKTRVTQEISGTQPWYCTDWDNFEKFNPLAE